MVWGIVGIRPAHRRISRAASHLALLSCALAEGNAAGAASGGAIVPRFLTHRLSPAIY
jgi:hypothetical protein